MPIDLPRLLPFARRACLVAVAAGAAGCAYRPPTIHVPDRLAAVAPGPIDVAEIVVVDAGRAVAPRVAAEVRRETVELLRGAKARGAPGGPARARVRVELQKAE